MYDSLDSPAIVISAASDNLNGKYEDTWLWLLVRDCYHKVWGTVRKGGVYLVPLTGEFEPGICIMNRVGPRVVGRAGWLKMQTDWVLRSPPVQTRSPEELLVHRPKQRKAAQSIFDGKPYRPMLSYVMLYVWWTATKCHSNEAAPISQSLSVRFGCNTAQSSFRAARTESLQVVFRAWRDASCLTRVTPFKGFSLLVKSDLCR